MHLHLPWLELCIALPLLGWLCLAFQETAERRHRLSIYISVLTFLTAVGAWLDFGSMHAFEARDGGWSLEQATGLDLFAMDELGAPLLPLASLQFLLIRLTTPRTKRPRFAFSVAMISESILLATLCCKSRWLLVALLSAAPIPVWFELKTRKCDTNIFTLHMALYVGLLLFGTAIHNTTGSESLLSSIGAASITAAVLIRCGAVPFHLWLIDLYDKAGFGATLLYSVPLTGCYAAMRLVLPSAPDVVLSAAAVLSMATAVYAAGMSFVQPDVRRFFGYLFISQSSLVLVGLEIVSPIGLTGALCLWLSLGLSLTGLGLTLRCLEARSGRLSMQQYHGMCEKTPMLAGFFLLTALSSIGFPGTVGFIALELLADSAIVLSPWAAAGIIIGAALTSLSVMRAYFHIFTGRRNTSTVDLSCRRAETAAVLIVSVMIIAGGLLPQLGVSSRYHAAMELTRMRREHTGHHDNDTLLEQHNSRSARLIEESPR